MTYKINNANIKDWAKNYDGELFDGILCDPPYELGFMGKSWDSTGIAFDVEMWQNIYKLLKPGAHLLAFSGSRTYHRMAVAIEDAGFEIRDMIEWVYGSGFPKSLNIGKAVDKLQGNKREITGYDSNTAPDLRDVGAMSKKSTGIDKLSFGQNPRPAERKQIQVTKGNSDWEGYGTALKPAHEPCVLARKPIEGTVAQNCLKHGVGGLNIDGTRIPTQEHLGRPQAKNSESNPFSKGLKSNGYNDNSQGKRFPANLIHDGSDEVLEVFPQTGGGKAKEAGVGNGSSMFAGAGRTGFTIGDSGSAARFFYTAKASKSERNAGLDGFEPTITNDGRKTDIDNAFQRGITERKNHHPTVKPLALTKYLANLIKPPKGGRLLVPFSGSGSEMIGALQAGWGYVEGVELTEEYIPIAEARIKYWLEQADKQGRLV